MNLPNAQTVMPDCHYGGPDPEGFMTRDEFVALLGAFAERNHLPVETACPVIELSGDACAFGPYRVTMPGGAMLARNVVIASGDLNRPRRQPLAGLLPPHLCQLHAAEYRNPASVPDGAVLVVGSGSSGGQIAEDLILGSRTVYLATGRIGRLPRRYRGRDIAFWMVDCGVFDVPRKDLIDPAGHFPARPLVGVGHTLSLQSLSAHGVVLLGRLTGVDGNQILFADDLAEHIGYGDEVSNRLKHLADDHIARERLDAPPAVPDPAEIVAPRVPDPPILGLDPASRGISTVIWCTGFDGDFDWVRLPVRDADGRPAHEDGVTTCPGIYFAGLDFLSTRRSGTVLAMADESRRTVEHIIARS